LILVDRELHDSCAARLYLGLGLLDMECFDNRQARPITTKYLAEHGNTAEHLLIHYEWILKKSSVRIAYEKIFECILDTYRGQPTCKFVGFTYCTALAPEPYTSVKASLKAETLPARFVLPQIVNHLGTPTYSMWSEPAVFQCGAAIKIVQDNGKKPDKQTELFVRPSASLDAAKAATEQSNRTVKEAVIFGHRALGRHPDRWDIYKQGLGLADLSTLSKLRLHNCDIALFSDTTLPASIEALAFIDNWDEPAAYNEAQLLEELLDVQEKTPESKGLVELVHIQKVEWRAGGYSTVDPQKLINFVSSQPRITVLCVHQDVLHRGSLSDFAVPTLSTFSFRDSLDNVVYTELKRFAEKAPNIKAWGGNWDSITLENHSLQANFQERAKSLVVRTLQTAVNYLLIACRIRSGR